jgi:hypothetical protein
MSVYPFDLFYIDFFFKRGINLYTWKTLWKTWWLGGLDSNHI